MLSRPNGIKEERDSGRGVRYVGNDLRGEV